MSITQLGLTVGHRGQGPTAVQAFTLDNGNGLRATVWDYGAHLVSVQTPDRNGDMGELLLGRAELGSSQSADRAGYQGATVGRYANRIAGGRFELDGKSYQLATNDGANHLHGGDVGFDQYVWQSESFDAADYCGVHLTHRSPDGDEGYPGTLDVALRYQLGPGPTLAFSYEAVTDAPTIVNLTNHAYWNLAGTRSLAGHELQLNASTYLPIDNTSIPTANGPSAVQGTAFDFRTPRSVDEPIDHCFVVDRALTPAATVIDRDSGRTMTVHTDQEGLQVYTAQHLSDGEDLPALCLEAQRFPDSPNRPDFSSPVSRPGQTYRHRTVHTFGLLEAG